MNKLNGYHFDEHLQNHYTWGHVPYRFLVLEVFLVSIWAYCSMNLHLSNTACHVCTATVLKSTPSVHVSVAQVPAVQRAGNKRPQGNTFRSWYELLEASVRVVTNAVLSSVVAVFKAGSWYLLPWDQGHFKTQLRLLCSTPLPAAFSPPPILQRFIYLSITFLLSIKRSGTFKFKQVPKFSSVLSRSTALAVEPCLRAASPCRLGRSSPCPCGGEGHGAYPARCPGGAESHLLALPPASHRFGIPPGAPRLAGAVPSEPENLRQGGLRAGSGWCNRKPRWLPAAAPRSPSPAEALPLLPEQRRAPPGATAPQPAAPASCQPPGEQESRGKASQSPPELSLVSTQPNGPVFFT